MNSLIFADIQITLPSRWKNETNITLSGPVKDGFAPSIALTRDLFENDVSLEEFVAFAGEQLQAGLEEQGYRVISESRCSFVGMPAGQRIYEFELDESRTLVQQMQIYFVRGREAMTVTCTDLATNFSKTIPAFQQVLESTRWADDMLETNG